MPVAGPIPEKVLALLAAATVFAVMFDLGLGIVLREFRWAMRNRLVVARGLFSVLIAVPAIALLVCRALDVPRLPQIGIVLMAIAPGAPVALRRSLDAGGHRSFAPALQILVALLAVVSMPLWVLALDEVYAGRATAAPSLLARQVFVAQLLPLALGMFVRRAWPMAAVAIEPRLARIGTLLLLLLVAVVLIDVWHTVLGAGLRVAAAIVVVTVSVLAVGHLLGGPEPATRTAVAICSAARNPGLALVVATLNAAPPAIVATIFAYLVLSAVTIVVYVAWRRRLPRPVDRS